MKRHNCIKKIIAVLLCTVFLCEGLSSKVVSADTKNVLPEKQYTEGKPEKIGYMNSCTAFFNTIHSNGDFACILQNKKYLIMGNVKKNRIKKTKYKVTESMMWILEDSPVAEYKKKLYAVTMNGKKNNWEIYVLRKNGKVLKKLVIPYKKIINKKSASKKLDLYPNYIEVTGDNTIKLAYGEYRGMKKNMRGGIVKINLKSKNVKIESKYNFEPQAFDGSYVYGLSWLGESREYDEKNVFYVRAKRGSKKLDYKIEANYGSNQTTSNKVDNGDFVKSFSWNKGDLVFFNKTGGIFYVSKNSTTPEKIIDYSQLKNYKIVDYTKRKNVDKGRYIFKVSLKDRNNINLYFTDDPFRESNRVYLVRLTRKKTSVDKADMK